jgi:hypothetical protein
MTTQIIGGARDLLLGRGVNLGQPLATRFKLIQSLSAETSDDRFCRNASMGLNGAPTTPAERTEGGDSPRRAARHR